MAEDLEASKLVTAEQREHYQRDGVICLRGAFSSWVERLRTAIERNIENPGPLATGKSADGKNFYSDRYMWTFDPRFRDYVKDSPAAAIAGEVMGSHRINIFLDHLFVKEPGAEQPSPWHQDSPYWFLAGKQICSVWLALDTVDRTNGILEFVRGSHRWNKRFEPINFKSRIAYYNKPEFEAIPDIEKHREDFDIVSWDMAPGDCLVFDGDIVHGAPGNSHSSRRRRALSTRWLGDDVAYHNREGIPQPIRDPGLKDGDPITCDLFPVIWSRPSL